MDFLRFFARSASVTDQLGSSSGRRTPPRPAPPAARARAHEGRRRAEDNRDLGPFAGRRWLFVSGKGGAGKSTTTAALAVAMARAGRRVLVATGDRNEHLSRLFGAPPLSPRIREVAANLWAVKLVPEASMREYGAMMLKSRLVYDALFNRRFVRRFLEGVPGLSDWAMLGKACYHAGELDAAGRPRFDTVLFDGPATGHALDMLRVPQVIVDVSGPGLLRRDAERALGMLRDPRQSGVVLVTLPEDLPTVETLEFRAALRDELGLPVAALVINAVVELLFTERERTELLRLPPFEPRDRPGEVLACAVRRAALERVQADALARLAQIDVPQVRFPYLARRATDLAGVEQLAARLRVIGEPEHGTPPRAARHPARSSVPPL